MGEGTTKMKKDKNHILFDGGKIKEIRIRQHISRYDLSKKSQVPYSTLRAWEDNLAEPRTMIPLERIAIILNCYIDDFCAEGKKLSVRMDDQHEYTAWKNFKREDKQALLDEITFILDRTALNEKQYLKFTQIQRKLKKALSAEYK